MVFVCQITTIRLKSFAGRSPQFTKLTFIGYLQLLKQLIKDMCALIHNEHKVMPCGLQLLLSWRCLVNVSVDICTNQKDEMSIAAQCLSTNKNQDSVSVLCAIDPIT